MLGIREIWKLAASDSDSDDSDKSEIKDETLGPFFDQHYSQLLNFLPEEDITTMSILNQKWNQRVETHKIFNIGLFGRPTSSKRKTKKNTNDSKTKNKVSEMPKLRANKEKIIKGSTFNAKISNCCSCFTNNCIDESSSNSKKFVTSSLDIVTPKFTKPKSILEKPEIDKPPIIINKSIETKIENTHHEETKDENPVNESEGKFRKRFMNRLPLNSGKIEDAGEYQWIHKPTVSIDLAHTQQLFLQLKSWIFNVDDLITRLSNLS